MKKEILKKYWWLGGLVIALPVVFNLCYLIPAFAEIFEEPKGWTIFWGAYLGAIISCTVSFVVLHKQLEQNHRENNMNRDNQRRTVEYQQAKQELDILRRMFYDYYNSFIYLELNKICEDAKIVTNYVFTQQIWEVQRIIDNKKKSEFNLYLSRPIRLDDYESSIFKDLEYFDLRYHAMLEDLKFFLEFADHFYNGTYVYRLWNRKTEVEEYQRKDIIDVQENRIYDIMRDYQYTPVLNHNFSDIINRLMETESFISEDKIRGKVKELIKHKTLKINQMLDETSVK